MRVEQQKRVLVVDDDVYVRELLESLIVQRGLAVDSASDGDEALSLIRRNTYSVVLLDLMMPVADGFVVLDSLRVQPPERMPVMLVVTGAYGKTVDQLDSKVIHGLIRKPFDADDVATLVSACAEVQSRSAFEAMAVAAIVAGSPLLALLGRL